MAKRFLETLGDSFEDDMLQDVIPMRKGKTKPKRKSFLDSLDKNSSNKKSSGKDSSNEPKKKRKSFLESIEDALENNAFDDIIPDNPSWRKNASVSAIKKSLETRLSTSVTTNVLDRAKEIAKIKNLDLKEVINIALKWYVESEGKV
ncbi:MAG: hypothetical protein AAF696_22715 [Bacteroidota bacterium]